MKSFFTFLFLAFSIILKAQSIIADPSLGQVTFTNTSNIDLPLPPTMPAVQVNILKVPIRNLNSTNSIPNGSTKIKIGLGSKLEIDPSFNLMNTNTSNYFSWSILFSGGQYQLTGDQIAPIPANFNVVAAFNIRGSIVGSSTVTANFLVTNHNTTNFLSDETGSNNLSSQGYLIIVSQVLPVNFKSVEVRKENCTAVVNFSTANEINLNRYEVEYSFDGFSFSKVGQLNPNINMDYEYKFNLPTNEPFKIVYIRVKSIDNDGSFKYSEIKILKDLCNKNIDEVKLFPNPLFGNTSSAVFIEKKIGVFSGTYLVSIYDFSGRKIFSEIKIISNQSSFKLDIKSIAIGSYLVKVENVKHAENEIILKLIKK